MWGLTGSLDARLAGDSKSADVAFDAPPSSILGAASAGAGKPTVAEVIVNGNINGQPFTIRRRRSSRKAELHFSVGGQDLTTQAVKDTQAIIDQVLGIKDGLLQRCCFFGQHTHTLHVRNVFNT
jgi:hypothetical protein